MKRTNNSGNRYCKKCRTKLQKNGFECGKQRWRCPQCKTATILARSDVARRNSKVTYTKYLLNKSTALEVSERRRVSRRTFDRKKYDFIQSERQLNNQHTGIYAKPVVTGEIYPYLIIDATSINGGVVAIVRDEWFVRNWQFAKYESSQVWQSTLRVLPKPGAVVSDGQKGITKALQGLWGDIVIQRCHFHVMQNMRIKLTRNPESHAGQDLKCLMEHLSHTKTELQMSQFIATFYAIYDTYEKYLNKKTFINNPTNKTGRKWFYTHRRVRSAYRQIASLVEQDQLFAYITHPELHLPTTTNKLEGGINSRLSELLRAHRGTTSERQKWLVSEFLISKSEG